MIHRTIKIDFKYKATANWWEQLIYLKRGETWIDRSGWITVEATYIENNGLNPKEYIAGVLTKDGIKFKDLVVFCTDKARFKYKADSSDVKSV